MCLFKKRTKKLSKAIDSALDDEKIIKDFKEFAEYWEERITAVYSEDGSAKKGVTIKQSMAAPLTRIIRAISEQL